MPIGEWRMRVGLKAQLDRFGHLLASDFGNHRQTEGRT